MSTPRTISPRLAAFTLGFALLLSSAAFARENVYTRLLKSTAYLMSPANSGTAWVYDREHGLLVTNYHVVDNHETGQLRDHMDVIFPVYRNGRVIAEQSYYVEHEKELRAAGRWLEGRVLDAMPGVDLAIVKVDHLPDGVVAVPLAADSPLPSDHLHSIGNPGGSKALWLYTLGEAKQVSRQSWCVPIGHRLVHLDATVVETQAPTNHGDSGGPVVNDAGELVAVTEGGSSEYTLLNTAIDVSEVRAYLTSSAWMGRVATAADYARRGRHYFADTYFEARSPRNNRLDLALADMNEAIRLDASRADYYIDRARMLEQRSFMASISLGAAGRPTFRQVTRARDYAALMSPDQVTAESDIRAALRLDPTSARAHARLASIHTTRGDAPALAVAELKAAVALDANCVEAYEQMSTLARFKDPQLEIRYLNEVLRVQPANAGALAERAAAYEQANDHSAALRDYGAALQLEPACGKFHRGRAEVYRKLNKLDAALVELAQTAMQLEPDNASNWLELGSLLVAGGKIKDAIEVYSAALEIINKLDLGAGFPEKLLAARGKAYAAGGDSDHARSDWQTALKLAKNSPVRDAQFEQELTQDLRGLEAVSVNN